MRIFKGLLIFLGSFILAWVIIFTFSQSEFRQSASIHFFTLKTKAFPLYIYVAVAFGLGLLAGFVATVYYGISMKMDIIKKDRIIKKLQQEVIRLGGNISLEQNDAVNSDGNNGPETSTEPSAIEKNNQN